MAVVGTSRYDKYDPISGGFRAALDVAWVEADVAKIFAVGLNTDGEVVKGAGNTGTRGVVVIAKPLPAGAIVDVMTSGEIVGATMSDGTTALTAGTVYYADPTTGALEASAATDMFVGYTVEATRLIVRMGDIVQHA